MKTYKVLLDDFRQPEDLYVLTHDEIFLEQSWLVVRSYEEFTKYIAEYYRRGAFPRYVTFDYELGTMQFERIEGGMEYFIEKNGAQCAQWLADFVTKNKVQMPQINVHASAGGDWCDEIMSKFDKVKKR